MNFEEFKQELLKNPKFKKVYEDKTDIRFEVAEMVHEARIRAGFTQAELAKKIGTKQSSVARIENETETTLPSLSFLKKIAEALDTSLLAPRFASLETSKPETQTRTYLIEQDGLYKSDGKITPIAKFSLGKVNTLTALTNDT